MNGRVTEWQLMQFFCWASARPAASACAAGLAALNAAASATAAATAAYDIDFIMVSASADARLVVHALYEQRGARFLVRPFAFLRGVAAGSPL
jgi:hypothetical protein